ncbi:carboxypeptidase regulatory-like domain-containing protein [bacterium]|nr:carboxypeptidase regulatory-like domain-containing protein [candidate division CSSED10-310 bacterium]
MKSIFTCVWRTALIALVGCCAWMICLSDEASAGLNGQIKGRVTDCDGNLIEGARVTLKNTSAGGERSIQTNRKGFYRFLEVAPGRYGIEVEKEGWSPSECRNFRVSINQTIRIDIVLFPQAEQP